MEARRDSGTLTTDGSPTSAFGLWLYVGEDRILQEAQPWTGDVGAEADYNRLEECDRLTMEAIHESGRLPRLKGDSTSSLPVTSQWSSLEIGLC